MHENSSYAKGSRDHRIVKGMQKFLQHMNLKGPHIDVSRDVSAFLTIPCFSIIFTLRSALKHLGFIFLLLYAVIRMRYCRVKGKPLATEGEDRFAAHELHSSKPILFDEAVLIGPMIATKEVSNDTSKGVKREVTGTF